MEFVKVLEKSELPPNSMVAVEVGGKKVLLANVAGSYHAIANRCTHLGGSLADGALQGSTVTCPRHGARFDVKTGRAVGKAHIAVLKLSVRDAETYVVKVEGTSILVSVP